MSRVDYIRCDMCRREFDPDAPMGYFMSARWAEGTEAFDLCAECKRMVECCCDYGICGREYQKAFDNEFGNFKAEADSILPDVADWALWWIPDHIRDMQGVACDSFAK